MTYVRDCLALLVVLLLLLLAAPASAQPPDDDPDPPIRAVVDAAIRTAGLSGNPGASLRRRARWAGLVPWITVRAARDLGWKEPLSSSITSSSTSSDLVDHGEVLELRATWRLDRLVFDASEPRAIALDTNRARARRELTREVIHLYFRRQRLRADPAADPLELDEVTALLDELTGGLDRVGS